MIFDMVLTISNELNRSTIIQFGRVGFVTNKRDYVKKNESSGVAMMMVGYALDSPSGSYRFYNPKRTLLWNLIA